MHSPRQITKSARLAVSMMFLVNGTGFATWVPHIPFVQEKFSLSESALGFCLLSIAAGALVSMPVTGLLISKYGSKSILKIISVVYCLVLPTMIAAPTLPLFVLALFLFGASNGVMDVSMNAHGVLVEKRLGKSVMSSFHGLFSLGGLAGASIAGLMLSAGLAPAMHTLIMSAILLILALSVISRLLPKEAEITGEHTSQEPVFVKPTGPLLGLGLMAFFILMVEGAMGDWTAIYIEDIPGTTEALAAAGFAAFSLTMAIGRLTGDYLIHRTGKITIVRYGILLSAAGLLLASLTTSAWLAIIGFALVGLGLSNVTPILFGAGGKVEGIDAGKGIAAVTTSGYTGFLVGPPLIGFIADFTSLSVSFLLLAGCFLIVSFFAKIVDRKQTTHITV